MEQLQKAKSFDKRLKPRKLYSGHIFFTTKNGLYEGRLKNYSQNGLYIESKASLSLGEVITAALPYMDNENAKCKGQVMWCNARGCGIELFLDRNDVYLKIVK